MSLTPFPNVFEIIRYLALSLDVKMSNKKLDDLVGDPFSDYRQIDIMVDSVLVEQLSQKVSPDIGKAIGCELKWLLGKYLTLVSMKPVDGLTREEVLPVLLEHWFVPNGLIAFKKVISDLPMLPSPFLFIGNSQRALENVFGWIEDNIDGWSDFKSELPKEKKDQISNWRKGKYLPDLQSLSLLKSENKGEVLVKEEWEKIIALIILARAIDSFRLASLGEKFFDEARQQLMGAKPIDNPFLILKGLQNNSKMSPELLLQHFEYVFVNLRKDAIKSESVKGEARFHLDELARKLKEVGRYNSSKHKLEQLEGRWCVFSGDLKGACDHYALAVESSLYQAGSGLKGLLEEAFCVAAKAKNATLMRNVKNTQILFKVDLESVNQDLVSKPSKKSEQFIQEWEKKSWASHFDRMFPAKGLFKSTKAQPEDQVFSSLMYDFSKKAKPDYQNPNKKIKMDVHKLKAWPQICWFTLMDEHEVVEKLINEGATMNIESSSGDTPLIMALEKLVIPELPYRSLDDSYLKLVLAGKGVEKTVNKQTQKKKLTPLIQAVGSGRPEIVKIILDLGAEVDLRGETDNQTALNMCIKWIGLLKEPEGWVERQLKHPITPELLDSLRRTSNGAMGATLEQQHGFFSPELNRMHKPLFDKFKEHILEHMTLINMREVLKLLLEAGADVNAAMQSPILGYTPIMLAAELDLDYEFSLMLQYKPDLDKEFRDPHNGESINCWKVAKYKGAKKILKILDDIKPHYQCETLIT